MSNWLQSQKRSWFGSATSQLTLTIRWPDQPPNTLRAVRQPRLTGDVEAGVGARVFALSVLVRSRRSTRPCFAGFRL